MSASGRRRDWGTWVAVAAFALAAGGSAALLFVPVYQGRQASVQVGTPTGDAAQPPPLPATQERSVSRTLLEVNGPGVLGVLAVPVVLAGLPLALARHRRLSWAARGVAAVLLLGYVVVTGFSIGLTYAPAALVMLLAAAIPRRAEM